MLDIFKKTFLAGLGALSLTKERAEQITEELVKKGEVSRDEAGKFVTELMDKVKEQREMVAGTVKQEFSKIKGDLAIVNRKEFESLIARIEVIEDKLGIIPVKYLQEPVEEAVEESVEKAIETFSVDESKP